MSKLYNKVAIITGGAKGIGRSTAELFAREGAITIIWDLIDIGQETADNIVKKGGKALFRKVNVAEKESVVRAVSDAFEKYGSIDILINNAGVIRDKSFLKMEDNDWESVIDVNLTGAYNCVKAVAPHMKAAGYGRIVSASSVVGLRGGFGQANYAASKAGLIGMNRVWAIELGPYGITANTVAPGYIETDMTATIPEEIKKSMLSGVPAGRTGQPEEIAKAYLFLASDDAAYINGICLSVDGGIAR